QAFVLEVTLAERHVPRRMAPQTYEIEDEFEVALLRLRERGDEARGDGGSRQHAGDQRSKHVGLLICQPAAGARLRATKISRLGGIYRPKYHKIFHVILKTPLAAVAAIGLRVFPQSKFWGRRTQQRAR